MQRRRLGRTEEQISELTFGCGAVGGLMTQGEPADQAHAFARALEAGVTFVDTAPSYGDGVSETNVGRLLRETGADVFLGTKVGIAREDFGDVAHVIRRSLDESLARLGRDSVDLLQLHNFISTGDGPRDMSPDLAVGAVADTFDALKAEGRIRFSGITAIGDTDGLHQLVGSGRFDTAQVVFNLLNPSAARAVPQGYAVQDQRELIKVAEDNGVGVIVIRSLAGGALSGSVERHPLGMPVVEPLISGETYESDVERAQAFRAVLEAAGAESLVELAIRYVISEPRVTTLQVGMATSEQFDTAIRIVEKGPLSADVLDQITRIQDGFSG